MLLLTKDIFKTQKTKTTQTKTKSKTSTQLHNWWMLCIKITFELKNFASLFSWVKMVYIRKARLLGSDSLLIIFCQKKWLFGEGDGLPKEKAYFTL